MAVEVTLKLPENLVEQAKRLGDSTQREVEVVLADALEIVWLTWESLVDSHLYAPASTLSDREVLALADVKLSVSQNRRLVQLQAQGKTTELSQAESHELLALLQVYQIGQLRKSEGLAEAVRRGLREPLSA